MSRLLRLEYQDALYHITSRGDRRESIYDDIQIPWVLKRAQPESLGYYEANTKNRNAAIFTAYASGGYSYQQIAEHFGVHFTTVGRIVRGQ